MTASHHPTGRGMYDPANLQAARITVQESISKPSAARVYDYLLGGSHNYAIDRQFGKFQRETFPDILLAMRTNRDFLGRAVRYAVRQGIDQFLDIGSGLPSRGNVHEVADELAPGQCRVVYVDNEPIAHAHAAILLADDADTTRHYALNADFFDYYDLWQQVIASGYLDPDKPVCLLTVALLHFMPPETHPEVPLAFYREHLSPGSLLVLSHVTNDELPDEGATQAVANYARTTNPVNFRSRSETAVLFGDWPLVEPGLVWAPEWQPDSAGPDEVYTNPARSKMLAGVARKPSDTAPSPNP